jgi:hypothetical protein
VIIATHSPTIVEAATFEELFLLRPVELVDHGENQLTRVAQDEDRFTALRTLFASTQNLTSLQPVVSIVHCTPANPGADATDRLRRSAPSSAEKPRAAIRI